MGPVAANISMLFRELPLLERFAAARDAGFDGVELQFPYAETAHSLASAAREAGTSVVLVNAPVLTESYSFGTAARPEMRDMFRRQLPQVLEYAQALGVTWVHILAGRQIATDERERCWDVYVENLLAAADVLGTAGIHVLIEPLNPLDVPNYQLSSFDDARMILERCGGAIGLQFDAYHAARMGLDPAVEFHRMLPWIRHVQFAGSPGRHEPGTGDVNFASLLDAIDGSQYDGWLAAEYDPRGATVAGLVWLRSWRSRRYAAASTRQ
jgi:hydroxypyruvate isomerase